MEAGMVLRPAPPNGCRATQHPNRASMIIMAANYLAQSVKQIQTNSQPLQKQKKRRLMGVSVH